MEAQERAAGAARMLGGNGGKRMSTGTIFFKTKLCSRFRAGTCPYITNCNFAHGMEELRKPPPGWEEFVNPPVVADGGGNAAKLRPCKRFFAEGVCPYGERCIFSHEDPAVKPAATTAISNASTAKPLNWKTRLCNKWETTGSCPFGDKCHFAHGIAELQKYGGGGESLPAQMDSKAQTSSYSDTSEANPSLTSNLFQQQLQHQTQQNQSQSQQQQSRIQQQKPPLVATQAPPSSKVWRGPSGDAISTVYGDWLEEEDEEQEQEEQEDEGNHPMELFYEELQSFH